MSDYLGHRAAFQSGHPIYDRPIFANYPPHKLAPKCQICGEPSRMPPYPLRCFQVGRRTIEACHICEPLVEEKVMALLNGLRRINGLEPLPPYPSNRQFGG